MRNLNNCLAFVSQIESKTIEEAENDSNWIITMEEELNQFKRNNTWTLVEGLMAKPIIGTKWIYRNKLDKNSIVVRNKARLVA